MLLFCFLASLWPNLDREGWAPLGLRLPAVSAGTPDLSIWIQPVASQHPAGNLQFQSNANPRAPSGATVASLLTTPNPTAVPLPSEHRSLWPSASARPCWSEKEGRRDAKSVFKTIWWTLLQMDASYAVAILGNYHLSLHCITIWMLPGFKEGQIPTNRTIAEKVSWFYHSHQFFWNAASLSCFTLPPCNK